MESDTINIRSVAGIMSDNPCLSCGACCAHPRASFYWAEADDAPGGQVPAQLTEQVHAHLRCMKGTNEKSPRCVAPQGEIGKQVACAIYELRPLYLPGIQRA